MNFEGDGIADRTEQDGSDGTRGSNDGKQSRGKRKGEKDLVVGEEPSENGGSREKEKDKEKNDGDN